MRNTYLKEVYNLAAKDRNVLSLVADNGMIVYDDLEEYFLSNILTLEYRKDI